jgi:2-polyprenyl-6-methoxyphenol hydroxylase-like FAD-dependent oxidoreductase
MNRVYDAIIVGARCAGSPTAMLLARKGYRVLLVDKATFPSDTISTHILWPHGAEILARWGLLDRLAATGLRPICQDMTYDVGACALRGSVPEANRGGGGFCPRRTVLDTLLLSAAAESGAEVREAFAVDEILFEGDRVVGIRGRHRGQPVEERARIVIGADGIHSFVAKAVRAAEYDTRPPRTCGYYSYFSGVPHEDMELYLRAYVAFGAVPTNDDHLLLMFAWPASEFSLVRTDIDEHVRMALELAPDLAERVRDGKRVERWYGMPGVRSYFRKPYGEGWALVGDASYNRDPLTAQGMSDAFLEAETLVEALHAAFSGRGVFSELLAAHEVARNERVRPMYEFTYEIAALEPPPPEMRSLFYALRGDPEATNAFLSAITGATPIGDFMSPGNLARILDRSTPRPLA